MKFFLITTDHFCDRIWFKDDEDFKAAMSLAAISAFITGVSILSFILMSNHVHFVLECEEDDARRFINDFKTRYGIYFSRRYGKTELLRRNGVDIRELPMTGEALERAIAYVQMNSVAANICLTPDAYPWGTGDAYFRYSGKEGRRLSDLSLRERRKYLHSHIELPGHYILLKDGYILPSSFVNVRFVETLYRSPKRMNYFLVSSSKARKVLSGDMVNLPTFKDQSINQSLSDLCQSLFGTRTINGLGEPQKAEVIKQLKYRFSADVGQLARVCGLPYEEVVTLLDEI